MIFQNSVHFEKLYILFYAKNERHNIAFEMSNIFLELQKGFYLQFWKSDELVFWGFQNLGKSHFFIENSTHETPLCIWHFKVFCVWGCCEMVGWKSGNEIWLNYTIMQFFRQIFNAVSSVQLLAANYTHVVLSLIFLWRCDN